MARKALGKGLDALFSSTEEQVALDKPEKAPAKEEQIKGGVTTIPIDIIRRNPYQPRRVFDDERLAEMAESIREHGVLQPILLRETDGGYELIAGERRFRAAGIAGKKEVPALIVKASSRDALEMGLIENLQREDLNPIEQAQGFKVLQDEFGLSQEEVALRVGLSREAVANSLRLLNLPVEVRGMIEKGRLSAGHGRVLLRIESDQDCVKVANLVIEKGLSVRELERLVNSRVKKGNAVKRRTSGVDMRFEVRCREAEEELLEYLETLIKIKPLGAQKGKIEIYFNGEQDLEDVVNKIKGIG